ncbi:beta-ketoacyl synthase [Hanstruepera neustonica]|uniref:Beta-ketoacyl synthase n=1 Tax=Hanstruepera neustonica TaxID=1445657 RepID=A0A2K1E3U2_9FLAO|nr:beta-ketoacyl synthase N-terminal-like domain-containing protein [Hanstruepera neustonica]PNQ74935.1 beta-ketoacyl synthase [Hanstruepera neustonica]
MKKPISITGIYSISPLGESLHESWSSYQNDNHCFSEKGKVLVAKLPEATKDALERLRQSDSKYKGLDDTTLFAIYTSRKAILHAQWKSTDNYGINIGSSRGATQLFEEHHEAFLKTGKAKPLTSPNSTLGNISSWVAHDLQTKGPEISHSITCSSALHAMLNGIAWIQSGMCNKFLVGGSEAPLTNFTIAQMQALKIYNKNKSSKYPCKALDFDKKQNSMILGEGASVACLENNSEKALANIIGVGYATEILEHNASLSTNADCFQRSMKMALGAVKPEEIDVIVTHTPGTLKGDLAEFNAIKKMFCNKIPLLTTNKWKIGHTLGASGMLNIEMAILMLKHQQFISMPYLDNTPTKHIKKVLVNAVGFGGNAVSILLSK